MSFSTNPSQQLSIFDSTGNLTAREKKLLENSWAMYFSEHIFPAINEQPFAVLYSDRPSRHNTPINIIIGALILKEIFRLTDQEIVDALPFDIRYQYALHTTSFEEQPLNDRTLGRFRARCNAYEETSGKDLIHDCIISLSGEMAKLMNLNSGMRRMDSLMVASNIKKMSRLELLYTCIAKLAILMKQRSDTALPEECLHYTEDDDHNRVLYHNRSEDTDSKTSQVLKDAALIISACGSRYDDTSEYQLLIRVIGEQTTKEPDGTLKLKSKSEGMNASIVQNPADPDATFRAKAGKEHRGYIANVVEESDGEQSIATDYQFEKNTYSDSQFVKDYIKQQPEGMETSILVADGGYCGYENTKLAAEKNITLITTDLKGADVDEFVADFQFNEDGTQILSCPNNQKPKSNVYDKSTGKVKASFPISTCRNCPYFNRCHPVLHKHVANVKIAQRTAFHAKQQKDMKTDEFKMYARFRNGVETIPAALRKRHNIDHMPVRGLKRCRLFFGFKIAAMNVRKLFKYLDSYFKMPIYEQMA